MAELNWDLIHAQATGEIGASANPVDVEELELALASVVLVDRRRNMSRLRSFIEELPYIALGYNARESAELQGLNSQGVQMRRRKAKAEYGVATTPQLVVATIQNRHIIFERETDPKPVQLTAKQRDVLHMTALGYSLREIADHLHVRPNRVQTHYEMIRLKLGARNMNHAMLRAFALSIFELENPIPSPEGLEAGSRLIISVASKEFGTNEADIVEPAELELLQTIGSMGASIFDHHQLYDAGYLSDMESKTARNNKYARTMGNLRRKLNASAGSIVLDRARIAEQRVYIVREAFTISSPNQSYILPATTKEDMAAALDARRENRPRPRVRRSNTRKTKIATSTTGSFYLPVPQVEGSDEEEPVSVRICGVKVFKDD